MARNLGMRAAQASVLVAARVILAVEALRQVLLKSRTLLIAGLVVVMAMSFGLLARVVTVPRAGDMATLHSVETVLGDLPYYGRHSAIGCAALNIYRERATRPLYPMEETDQGLMALGWMPQTRLALRFHQKGHPPPENLCDVVWEAGQFSWTAEADAFKFGVAAENVGEFRRAYRAALAVQLETAEALSVRMMVRSADHYYVWDGPLKVDPGWAASMQFQARIGYHRFMEDVTRYPTARRKLDAFYDRLVEQRMRERLVNPA